jgi:hypothetical protein
MANSKSLWDYAYDAGSAAMDFAMEYPEVTGALGGLAVHHLTGGEGKDNLAAMAGGATLGMGANYLFGNQAPSAPTGAGGTYGAGVPVSAGATMGAGATGGGGGGKPGEDAMANAAAVGNTGVTGDTGGTMMGKLGTGLTGIRKYASENEPVMSLVGKAGAAYLGNRAQQPVRAYNEQYRTQADAAQAANAALVGQTNAGIGKQNAIMDQLVADASAIDPQRAATQAYSAGLSRTREAANKAKARSLEMGRGAPTADAEQRRASVGGTTEATTLSGSAFKDAQARRTAGLGAAKYTAYQTQAVPSYDTSYATNAGAGSDTAGITGLYEDVFGLEKKKAQTETGG